MLKRLNHLFGVTDFGVIMKIFLYLAIITSCLIFTSCATTYQTYSGKRLPAAKEALLNIDCQAIEAVDGKPLVDIFDNYKQIAFKQGKHNLAVNNKRLIGDIDYHKDNISFMASPGKTYSFDCEVISGLAVIYSITDVKTGEVVATTKHLQKE